MTEWIGRLPVSAGLMSRARNLGCIRAAGGAAATYRRPSYHSTITSPGYPYLFHHKPACLSPPHPSLVHDHNEKLSPTGPRPAHPPHIPTLRPFSNAALETYKRKTKIDSRSRIRSFINFQSFCNSPEAIRLTVFLREQYPRIQPILPQSGDDRLTK